MPIKFEKKNHVAYITINNPEKANIMDRETNNELDAAWREIWEDLDVRATILTGAGDKYFCAGHNIQVNPDVGRYLYRRAARTHLLHVKILALHL